jgi:hypothetical protein
LLLSLADDTSIVTAADTISGKKRIWLIITERGSRARSLLNVKSGSEFVARRRDILNVTFLAHLNHATAKVSVRILVALVFLQCLACSSRVPSVALPDSKMTPGDTMDVTNADICARGYTKLVRDVSATVKREAYAQYGRSKEKGKCCEVDHLIPLELGGSNRLKNLWPEPYDIEWNARVKDRLENRLHTMVCSGQIDLPAAQKAIATDWIAAYKQYIGETPNQKSARHRR